MLVRSPKPPKKENVPPKFCGENCETLAQRKRPPALIECWPNENEVLLVSSASSSVLLACPIWDPPPVKASCTSMVGIELSAFCRLWLCSNWKRVSLTMVLLITDV